MKDLPLKDKIEIAAEQIEQSDEVGCLTAQQLRHILTSFADSLVKNIAYEPVLGVGVSNDSMGDAAKAFTDNNTDFTKLGIYTAYYNGARWMRDELSDTNA